MAEMKSILVNGKQYKVQMLSVLDTLDLHLDTMSSLGGLLGKLAFIWTDAKNGKSIPKEEVTTLFQGIEPERLKPLKKRVFGQVITPENRFLGDEIEIERWFSQPENREDVWEVLIKSTIELLGEYAPSFLKEMTKIGMKKVSEAKESKSQESTEQTQSSTTP